MKKHIIRIKPSERKSTSKVGHGMQVLFFFFGMQVWQSGSDDPVCGIFNLFQ